MRVSCKGNRSICIKHCVTNVTATELAQLSLLPLGNELCLHSDDVGASGESVISELAISFYYLGPSIIYQTSLNHFTVAAD